MLLPCIWYSSQIYFDSIINIWNWRSMIKRCQSKVNMRSYTICGRFQRPRGLSLGSAVPRLVGLRVRLSPGGVNVCLWLVWCFVKWRPVRRADYLSRGVLPSVVCLNWVWPWSLGDEDALAQYGALVPWEKNKIWAFIWIFCRLRTCVPSSPIILNEYTNICLAYLICVNYCIFFGNVCAFFSCLWLSLKGGLFRPKYVGEYKTIK